MRYSTSTVPVPVHTRRRYYYEYYQGVTTISTITSTITPWYYEEAILVHTINRFKRYGTSSRHSKTATLVAACR